MLSKHRLLKLDFDSVRGKTQDWIRDFLRDRALHITVDKERSTTGQIISDVSTEVCLSVCPTVILAVQCKIIFIKRLHSKHVPKAFRRNNRVGESVRKELTIKRD